MHPSSIGYIWLRSKTPLTSVHSVDSSLPIQLPAFIIVSGGYVTYERRILHAEPASSL